MSGNTNPQKEPPIAGGFLLYYATMMLANRI